MLTIAPAHEDSMPVRGRVCQVWKQGPVRVRDRVRVRVRLRVMSTVGMG